MSRNRSSRRRRCRRLTSDAGHYNADKCKPKRTASIHSVHRVSEAEVRPHSSITS